MRAIALLLVLALALPAKADECPPVPPQGERHIVLDAGQVAPVRGVFASEPLARYDYARLSCAEAARDACYRNFDERPPPWYKPFMWGGIAGVLVGVLVVGLAKK